MSTLTREEEEALDRIFNAQYRHGGGFCGDCGLGLRPFVKGGSEEMFGLCQCRKDEKEGK